MTRDERGRPNMNESMPDIVESGVCGAHRITKLQEVFEVKCPFYSSKLWTCFAFALLRAAKSKHLSVCLYAMSVSDQ
jgi:hypothetical protein